MKIRRILVLAVVVSLWSASPSYAQTTDITEQITPQNAGRLELLRTVRLGKGRPNQLTWRGNLLVIPTTVGIWEYPDFTTEPHLIRENQPHLYVSYSADGRLAASQDYWTVDIWDVQTGQNLASYTNRAQGLWAGFSPDSKTGILVSDTSNIWLWDARTLKLRKLLGGTSNEPSINRMAFSPDSSTLAVTDRKGTLQAWNVTTGALVWTAKAQQDHVFDSVVYSPDGKNLAVEDYGGLYFFDAHTGRLLVPPQDINVKSARWLFEPTYRPDGKVLLVATGSPTIMQWDAKTLKPLPPLISPVAITAVFFTADGRHLVGYGDHNQVLVWDANTLQLLHTLQDSDFPIEFGRVSPDGRQFVAVSSDQLVHVWDIATGRRIAVLRGFLYEFGSVKMSRTGELLSFSLDGMLRYWDLSTGEAGRRLRVNNHDDGRYYDILAVSADGNLIAYDHFGKVLFQNLRTGKLTLLPYEPTRAVQRQAVGAAFTVTGQILIAVYADGKVIMWDTVTSQQHRAWDLGREFNDGLDFTANGEFMVSGDSRRYTRVWMLGEELPRISYPDEYYFSLLRISPDRKLLAGRPFYLSPLEDDEVMLWDMSTGKQLGVFPIPDPSLLDVLLMLTSDPPDMVFSPDSAILATRSGNRVLRLWDAQTQQQLVERRLSSSKWLSFSLGGKYLYSLDKDGELEIWGIPLH
jgi:WD40 repeat protein